MRVRFLIAAMAVVAGSCYVSAATDNGCGVGRVGDANGIGGDEPTIGDVSLLINAKFISLSCDSIPCLSEADINQSGGANPTCDDITIGDISMLIDYLFITGKDNMTLPECLWGTVTDIDGNVYQTVTIGTQVWMAENLKVTHYRNGDTIPGVPLDTYSGWEYLTTGAHCSCENSASDLATYGRLYNWYAVGDIRRLAPAGWHVPTYAEWQTLANYLGGIPFAGGKMKEAGTTHWAVPNTSATNESGFSALPGGFLASGSGCTAMGQEAHYWVFKERDWSGLAVCMWLHYRSSVVQVTENFKEFGYSVRCVKDVLGPQIPVLTTAAVIDITQGTAECGGTITSDGGATVTARGVCWNTIPTPFVSSSKTSDGSGTGAFTSSLAGLSSGTLYYVWAYATNSVGTAYGGAVTFTTPAATPARGNNGRRE